MSPRLHTTAIFDEGIVYLVLGLGLPAICLTVFVLLASAYLAWHPASRAHLDRVSFRLLVYALLANLTFGITFVIGALTTTPSAGCSFVAFLIYLSRLFSSGMFFCMALNLQLVLVHGVNGQMMEKYYILGTSLLSLACGVAPYAAGALGWNAVNQTCEFKNSDPTGFWWLIGTQTIWVLLMVSGEIITFLVIVAFIISYQLDTRRYRSESTGSQEYYPGDCQSEITRSPIARYRNIILRIGLYPVLSCLMSFSTCILDIHQTRTPEPSQLTETNWRLGILDISIYCVRPLLYSILAVADPVIIHARLHGVAPSSRATPKHNRDPL
ncbi:hypothetical protein DFH07DRAFT_951155 [Mycena maculata]|uniref:G-protein coupled receptors family 2 profile 2 domain-containing protein n=1 Tax=Mycena maculata TaxID=230809 RepID=A0AAD7K5J0_9AGAR|nr:hypothetical protein DFH07DRAFT_951155 [Mycena maculata]